MGEYRIVTPDGSVTAVFTAVDDAAGIATARAEAAKRSWLEQVFTVQRERAGRWSDVITWVVRPAELSQPVADGAVPPARSARGIRREVLALDLCCNGGGGVHPRPCPQHGRQVPPDIERLTQDAR